LDYLSNLSKSLNQQARTTLQQQQAQLHSNTRNYNDPSATATAHELGHSTPLSHASTIDAPHHSHYVPYSQQRSYHTSQYKTHLKNYMQRQLEHQPSTWSSSSALSSTNTTQYSRIFKER
jgi:hypothetical protein